MERSFRSLLLIPCLHPRSNTGEHGVERRSIVDLATQYDCVDFAQRPDVLQGISFDQQQIRRLPRRHGSEAAKL